MINIKGIDKAAVLAALYNAAMPLDMGYLNPKSGQSMTVEEARAILAEYPRPSFDYVQGRPIKVNLSGDEFDPRLFDRDAGEGAALSAVAPLGAKAEVIGIPGPGSHGEVTP